MPSRQYYNISKLIANNNRIVLPGVYDSLGAKIIEEVRFDAMFQIGYGSAASYLVCQILDFFSQNFRTT